MDKFPEFIKGFTKTYGLRINSLKCTNYQNYPYLKIIDSNPLVDNGFYYNQDLEPGKHPYHHAEFIISKTQAQ